MALAQYVSFAVRVDPALLRAARLALFPASDAGLEADLWFSPLVTFRMPSGATLDDSIAADLRQRLWTTDRAGYEKAWALTRTLHANLSPAVQLEEELAYLEIHDDPEAQGRIAALLQSAVAAMIAGNHKGLAHWAARALPRLSERIRSLEPAQMLAAGASVRLRGKLPTQSSEAPPQWMPWVVPSDVPGVVAAVRLINGAIEIGDPKQLTGAPEIRLPETEPLLLTVIHDDGSEETVKIPARLQPSVRVPISGGPVRLRTLLGETFLLDARAAGVDRRADEILDMRPERERHRDFFGRERLLSHLDGLLSAPERSSPWIVLAGGEGVGKTAVVARMLARLESRGVLAPHHFFNPWIPRLRDPAAAIMSICAQIEQRYPELALPDAHPRSRLAGLLGSLAARSRNGETEKIVIVLDGLDAIDPLGRNRLRDYLPAHVAQGVTYLAPTSDPDALRDMTGRSQQVVVDLSEEQWREPRRR